MKFRQTVLPKCCNDPIHLAWMVKKVEQLTQQAATSRPHPACLDGEAVWSANRNRELKKDPVRLARTVNEFSRLSPTTRVSSGTPSPMWQAHGGREQVLAFLSQSNSFTGGTSPPGC